MKKTQPHPYDELIAELRAKTNQVDPKVLRASDEALRKILAPKKPAKKKPCAKSK